MTRRSRLFDKVSKHFFWWPGRELEPASIDGVSYGLAALLYRGRPLIAVAQTAAGCSLYPFSPAVIEAVAPLLDVALDG